MIRFSWRYFVLAVIIFIVEVLIALYVNDSFIRPYFGDFLVVILIYCAVRSVINARPLWVAIGTLLFAYLIEYLQYIHVVDRLGWSDSALARTVIGSGFEWRDIVCYTVGIVVVLMAERKS